MSDDIELINSHDRWHDLGIQHHSRRIAGGCQPLGDGIQVARSPDRDAVQPDGAAQRGEVDVREPHDVERVALRSEVVHFGAIRGVVVDHDQHPQAESRHRLQVGQPNQCTPVAKCRHRQLLRPRKSRADTDENWSKNPDQGAQYSPTDGRPVVAGVFVRSGRR